MDIDLAALPDDVDTLQQMVRTLAAERAGLAEAQAEIERLRLIIRKLQRNQFGRRAESLDDDQLRLGFDDLEGPLPSPPMCGCPNPPPIPLSPGRARSSPARASTSAARPWLIGLAAPSGGWNP